MKHKTYALIGFLFFGSLLQAADWPRWRGADANGISKETNWNPRALEKSPVLIWESDVGKGHSSVIIVNNRLYTTGNRMAIVEKDALYEEVMFCLDVDTGSFCLLQRFALVR